MSETGPKFNPEEEDLLIPEELVLQFPEVAETYEDLAKDYWMVVEQNQELETKSQGLETENDALRAHNAQLEQEIESLRLRLGADGGWDPVLEIARSAMRNRRNAEVQMRITEEQTQEIIDLRTAVVRAETTDAMTGLLNSAGLEQAYDKLAEQKAVSKRRDYEQSTILFLDLDKFKLVNDTLGHFVGDATIKEVATRLQQRLRDNDIIGRKGGDEFVIILPFTGEKDSVRLAEELRMLVQDIREINGIALPDELGVSIGVSEMDPELNFAGSASKANRAMKAAKEEGRNRVIVIGNNENATSS